MKIVDVKTFVVGNPPPRFGGRYFILSNSPLIPALRELARSTQPLTHRIL